MEKRIYLSPPHLGGEEIKIVEQAFLANWIAPAGPDLNLFEEELCTYNSIAYCAALSSGTAAIHLALMMLGVEQDDEVICSDFTFSGSCNPIVYQKAIPVFVDSEVQTWNMDPQVLEDAIKDRIRKGKKPKAIIVVHLYGMPAQLESILNIASHYQIPVIEDAAEGLGSSYKNKKLGTFSDIGVYSFNGNKIITTSGGGAMVSQNETWIKKAKFLSQQARDPAPHYQHSHVGYNYRLSNICAAIGRGQLKVLDDRVAARRKNFETYQRQLRRYDNLSYQEELPGCISNRWLTCVLLDKKMKINPEEIRLALEAVNIESRPLWKPMHLQPVFRDAPFYGGGIGAELFKRGLCLPSGSDLSIRDMTRIVEVLRNCLER